MKKVTVIVPIYNGFEYLKPCIDSVLKHTKKVPYELLLLNDCSPDKRVKKYLDSLKNPKIKLIHNEKNLGFVKNCNNGIKMSKNNVVLLNSDTEVTENWLGKLQEAAYSDEYIASVTPFTNNGMQVSIPKQWKDNKIPKGYTVDAFAKLVEENSMKLRPQLTTGVGFCLYMKRGAIDTIGYLNEEDFGRGYGEESDWCMRANRAGFKNVLDDQTFIYHKGNVSFSSVSKIDEHKVKIQELFHQKYPEARKLLEKYEGSEALRLAIQNIDLSLYIDKINQSEKKNILFVSFDGLENLNVGAFKHVKDLIRTLGDKYNFFNLYYYNKEVIIYRYKTLEQFEVLAFRIKKEFNQFKFEDRDVEKQFSTILKLFRINIAHFQTPQALPLSLMRLAKSMSRVVLYTAHEFLLYCPKFDLVTYDPKDNEYKFCNFEKNDEVCYRCLNFFFANNNLKKGYLKKRRDFIRKNVLPHIDVLVTPSKYLQDKIAKIYKNTLKETHLKIIEHGLEVVEKESLRGKIFDIQNDEVNVAFLGAFNEIKGSRLFAKLVHSLANRANFFIIGRIEDHASFTKIKKKCHHYGEHRPDEAVPILKKQKIDLGLILSVAEESFSFTLSEFWAAGVPVIAINRGAVGVRMMQGGMRSLLIDKDVPFPQLVEKLKDIIANKKVLEDYKRNLPRIKSLEENMREYARLYNTFNKKDRDEVLTKEERIRSIKAYSEYKRLQETGEVKEKYERLPAKLTWQNHCYIFLAKISLAKPLRPIYRWMKRYIKWL